MNTFIPQLEICVDSVSGVDACVQGGADRIELCAALATGGLTASVGFMNVAAQTPLPVHALIRPRSGDFCYSSNEVAAMCIDIDAAAQAGICGVVLGAATSDQSLDLLSLQRLCKAAGDMKKTLHRVIDTVKDQSLAVRQAIDLGFDYILTSGGEVSVKHSIAKLAELNMEADEQIKIIAGGGLPASMIPTISVETGIHEFHTSCKSRVPVDQKLIELGFVYADHYKTDADKIRQYQQAIMTLN